jgi:hypothetical protein
MATKALPRFIKVHGRVYKLAAELQPAVQQKLEKIKQKSQQERQETMETEEQKAAKLKISLATVLVKAFSNELGAWVKTFNMPPPTKGEKPEINAQHAFIAFKDAFLAKSKEITDKALNKAAEVLKVPVTASTRKR